MTGLPVWVVEQRDQDRQQRVIREASAEERGEEKEHDDDDEEGFDGDGDQVSDFAWYGTTTAIIMFVLGVAMFIPSVKIPLSFVGAVSGSLMVFIWRKYYSSSSVSVGGDGTDTLCCDMLLMQAAY